MRNQNQRLGALLRTLRTAANLTPTEAGARVGLRRAAVYQHEGSGSSAYLPPTLMLVKLLRAYSASPADCERAWLLLRCEAEQQAGVSA